MSKDKNNNGVSEKDLLSFKALSEGTITHQGQSICLADVEEKEIQWLYPGRIPLGKLTIIAGEPDVGKSFLTLDIASRVSNGTDWPDGMPCERGNVLLMSAEDDVEDTIKPRLRATNADMNRIHALQSVVRCDPEREEVAEVPPNLLEDLEAIRREIEIHHPSLLIIDPLNAYLPGIDTHRDAALRAQVFAPLQYMAQYHNVAVICVNHLNKSTTNTAKNRINGSIAYTAAARTAWLIANDQDDHNRKLMLCIKLNIGPKPHGLAYRINTDAENEPTIQWESEPLDMTADEALQQTEMSNPSERDEAEEFLRKLLANGPVPSQQIIQEAESLGISERTLKRAKKKLSVEATRIGEKDKQGGGSWYWRFPIKSAK